MTIFDAQLKAGTGNGKDKKRAVIYARVSTELQTTSNQIAALEGWAKNRGWRIVGTYRENESAWVAGHQKELSKLYQAAYKGKFDLVLVWSLDRVTRQGPLEILRFIHSLRALNVQMLSLQDSWTEAPGELGDLLLSLTGWVARFYSDRLSINTKAGIERRRRDGKPIGRPRGSGDTKKRKKRVTK